MVPRRTKTARIRSLQGRALQQELGSGLPSGRRLAPLLSAWCLLGACARPAPVEAPPPTRVQSPPLLVARAPAAHFQGPEVCFNAIDDNENGLFEEGCGVDQGLIQFVLAWEGEAIDLDLEVMDPENQVARVGQATGAGLELASDCPSTDQPCPPQPLENVYLRAEEVTPGPYRVLVRLGAKAPSAAELLRAPLRAQLGVRLPSETLGFELAFSEPGQVVDLTFVVPESPDDHDDSVEEATPPPAAASAARAAAP